MTIDTFIHSARGPRQWAGSLTVTEWGVLSSDERARLLALGVLAPMAGGSDQGGGDPAPDPDPDPAPDPDPEPEPDPDPEPEPDGGDDPDALKAELERQRRRADKAEKAAKQAAEAERKRRMKAAEDNNEFQKLYEEEQSAHTKTRTQIKEKAREATLVTVASRLGMKDPGLAKQLVHVDLDSVVDDDFDVDERPVERAVKNLLKTHRYLFDETKVQGADAGKGERKDAAATPDNGRTDPDPDKADEPLRPRDRLRRYHEQQEAEAAASG